MGNTNSIRNKDGYWINTSVFRTEAIHFEKNGYYCPHTWGSLAWKEYWEDQKRKCIEGVCIGDACITGNHYFYLNFIKIKAKAHDSKRKILRFPDFWDGDYDYFWTLEIAEKGISYEDYLKLKLDVNIDKKHLSGGKHLMIAKARRKGYSYKNAAVLANAYHTVKGSLSLIGSFDKKYSNDAFRKAKSAIDFVDEHTGWRKQRLIDTKSGHIQAGYVDMSTGVPIDKGYLSEIQMLTFQDNPDAARGKDAFKIILEEMGTFPNAIDTFTTTEPSVKDGDIMTGMLIMYGTSSTKENMTIPFKEMFYNPDLYNILPFTNIWDKDSKDTECSFFHPVYLNKQGYYDKNGNSDIQKAIESENIIREKKKTNSTALNNYVVENPMSPEEAFRSGSINIFPIAELERQLKIVLNNEYHLTKGQPVNLFEVENRIEAKPILDLKSIEPIYFYKQDVTNSKGEVIIYEYPILNPPKGLYKIGFDPYAQDQSSGDSLASIYVFKGIEKSSYNKNTIVAQYVGRPPEADDVSRIALKLAKLYNTEVMYENMFIHVKTYFRNRKMLNYLAMQPDGVISKSIKSSTVSRIYGIHMTEQLKDAGEKYIKDWLLEIKDIDEDGNEVRNIDYIWDAGLLQELIRYNRKGNFDRVMSLMMVMFQVEEEGEKEYNAQNQISAIKEWKDFLDKFKYKR